MKSEDKSCGVCALIVLYEVMITLSPLLLTSGDEQITEHPEALQNTGYVVNPENSKTE